MVLAKEFLLDGGPELLPAFGLVSGTLDEQEGEDPNELNRAIQG